MEGYWHSEVSPNQLHNSYTAVFISLIPLEQSSIICK